MINVVDRAGSRQQIQVEAGRTLMPQLRPLKLGIIGLCNGNMACGTCHVYVEAERQQDLVVPDEDELEMLEELSARLPNSRLTCQIVYDDRLDGLVLTVAPRT